MKTVGVIQKQSADEQTDGIEYTIIPRHYRVAGYNKLIIKKVNWLTNSLSSANSEWVPFDGKSKA